MLAEEVGQVTPNSECHKEDAKEDYQSGQVAVSKYGDVNADIVSAIGEGDGSNFIGFGIEEAGDGSN